MIKKFPRSLKMAGFPIVGFSWLFAARLVWEQTVWSWERGRQMVGFSLAHSGWGVMLVLIFFSGFLWAAIALVMAVRARSFGDKSVSALLVSFLLAWAAVEIPYGFWQRLFIEKFSAAHSIDFFTHAASSGDIRTVVAFLDKGIDINSQDEYGTALHGAAAQGDTEMVVFLIAHGADVNALNAYGDSPMASAIRASEHASEISELLSKHGGKIIRGSEDQRDRIINEQVKKDIEKLDHAFEELSK